MSYVKVVHLIVVLVLAAIASGCAALSAPMHPVVPPTWPDGPPPPRFQENVAATYRVATGDLAGTGTAAAIAKNGCLVTVGHIADASTSVVVAYNALGERLDATARVVVSDPIDDVSIIRVTGATLTPVEFGSTIDLAVGEPVYALGYPHSAKGNPEIRDGSVFMTDYSIGRNTSNYILLHVTVADMDSEPGMSGAGIFRQSDGKIIGVLRGSLEIQGEWYAYATPVERISEMLARSGCGE